MAHKHEWVMKWHDYHEVMMPICLVQVGPNSKCHAMLTDDEILNRLNAVECLSAEFAMNARRTIAEDGNEYMLPVHEALKAYAAALEERQ